MLGSFDDLAGLPCTVPGARASSVRVLYTDPVSGVATLVCGTLEDRGLTAFDSATGLEWDKKTTALGSGPNFADLHDVDNYDSWEEATGSWIAAVYTEGFASHNDWRLPTIAALQTIVDTTVAGCGSGPASPCIDPIFGPTLSLY